MAFVSKLFSSYKQRHQRATLISNLATDGIPPITYSKQIRRIKLAII